MDIIYYKGRTVEGGHMLRGGRSWSRNVWKIKWEKFINLCFFVAYILEMYAAIDLKRANFMVHNYDKTCCFWRWHFKIILNWWKLIPNFHLKRYYLYSDSMDQSDYRIKFKQLWSNFNFPHQSKVELVNLNLMDEFKIIH